MSVNVNWFKPLSTGRGPSTCDKMTIKKIKSGRKDKVNEYAISVVIPEEMMKKARFVVGDRAIIGFGKEEDGSPVVIIKRVVDGGYKIGPATGSSNNKQASGKSVRSRIQLTLKDGMFDSFCSKSFEINDDGTLTAWGDK